MKSTPQDLLKDYKAKRNFARTQEPSGDASSADRQGRGAFVVQKHDATRLHYDFRIELDGVLKSWAVTKGPSNNPADKRLAVRVEDHPLDYGGFEGTIPAGEYGGGTVMLWDRGTWEPLEDPHEGLARGELKMRLFGERMKGEWVLVHMKGRDTRRRGGPDRENWLLIKHRDSYARDKDTLTTRFTRSVASGRDFDAIARGAPPARETGVPARAVWHSDDKAAAKTKRVKAAAAALPAFRPPQLATLVDTVPAGSNWLFEMKYDGYRCLAAVAGEAVRLHTRNGKDWTGQFGALAAPLGALGIGSALIDGEICAFDRRGRTDFTALKAVLSHGGRLEFFAFDLLELDGRDLTRLPLAERKLKLKALLAKAGRGSPVQYSEHVAGHGEKVLAALCRDGHEGVIAKRADAPYRSERNRDWLKVKCTRRQEFVIGGWSPSAKRNGFASLLVGAFEDGKLVYRGRVGTGFDNDSLIELGAELDKRRRKTSPFTGVPAEIARRARWVEPELVGEIAYAELTGDGMLRHPSFIGLRGDKPAAEVRMETSMTQDASGAESPGIEDGEVVAERLGVRLTSPDRVVFPGQGVTKADLVGYYEAVAEAMLPHIARRPLSLVRCPQGRAKACFFQKHDTGGFPPQMQSMPIAESDGERQDYFFIEDLAGLVAGTQMNVLEWHIWGSRCADVEKPDRLVFDIDPDVGLDFAAVRDAAVEIRERLDGLGLVSYAMVSGGKGIHVVVPLRPRLEWDAAKAFCRAFAQQLAAAAPERFTAHLSKARRKGRLFLDYLRNERGSTAISPWSVRSREGAPVAVPVSWDEVPGLGKANGFSLAAAAERAGEDVWSGYFDQKQSLTKAILGKLGG